jgi:hypothetical protein
MLRERRSEAYIKVFIMTYGFFGREDKSSDTPSFILHIGKLRFGAITGLIAVI